MVSVVLFFIILSLAKCEETRYFLSFRSGKENEKLDVKGEERETINGYTPPIACVRSCTSHRKCKAVNIGPSGQCDLLMTYLCDEKYQLISADRFQYYDVDSDLTGEIWNKRITGSCKRWNRCSLKCQSRLGNICFENYFSEGKHMECRHGRYRCILGFHYNPVNDSCTKVCKSYSSQYSREGGTSLAGHNTQVQANLTQQSCLNRCANAAFTCRSVDFNSFNGECFMSKSTCADYPGDCISSSLDHFTRHCQ